MDVNDVKVQVNGKDVDLNPFAASIVGNIVCAMVSSLKLDGEPREIEIRVSKN